MPNESQIRRSSSFLGIGEKLKKVLTNRIHSYIVVVITGDGRGLKGIFPVRQDVTPLV